MKRRQQRWSGLPAVASGNRGWRLFLLLVFATLPRLAKGTRILPPPQLLRSFNKDTALRQAAGALAAGAGLDASVAALQSSTPPRMHYTAGALTANDAVAVPGQPDVAAWLRGVNAILAEWNASDVRLLASWGDGAGVLAAGTPAIDYVGGLAPAVPPTPIPLGPLISVIMVAYNSETTLPAAAASILAQSWRPLELIVVDDASSDGTWAVAQHLRTTDARVRLLRNRVRVGPYVSRNIALRDVVRGQYVTCHDADDWAHPDRLAAQVRPMTAATGAARATVAYMLRVLPDGRVSTDAVSWFCPDGVTRMAMVSAMYERRLLVDRLGYWDTVWYGGDAELIGRAHALLGRPAFAEVPVITMVCRDRAAGLGKAGYVHGSRDRWTNSTRQQYRQAFTAWHVRIARHGADAYLPFGDDPGGRKRRWRLEAPPGMRVPDQRVRRLAG